MREIYSKDETKKLYYSLQFQKALLSIEFYANLGDPFFLNALGYIYSSGKDEIKINYKKAYFYTLKAAELNYPKAYYNLSFFYAYGQYVDKDEKKCLEYLLKAANLNHIASCGAIASYYITGSKIFDCDYSKAFKYASVGKNEDHVCCRILANFYDGVYGDDIVKKDLSKAEEFYLKSLEIKKSRVTYMNFADFIINNPVGIKSTYDDALNYYLQADDMGDVNGKIKYDFELIRGNILHSSDDNIKEELKFLDELSEYNSLACYYLGEIYSNEKCCKLVKVDKKKAFQYYKNGAILDNNGSCLFKIGIMIENNDNNLPLAMLYIMKSMEIGKLKEAKDYINLALKNENDQAKYLDKFLQLSEDERYKLYEEKTFGGLKK